LPPLAFPDAAVDVAGIVKEIISHKPLRQISISIKSGGPRQERPVCARGVHTGEVNGHNQNFLLGRAGFGEDFARRAGHETLAPEFNAFARKFFVPDRLATAT